MQWIFETPHPVRLHVENEVGLVVLTARPTGETVVSLDPDTPGAEELVERSVVECRRGDVVVVRVPRLHGMRFVRRNGVTVRVQMPEGSDLTVVTGAADVEVMGPVGAVDVKTASGDVSTDDVAAEVRAKTASGDVTVGSVGGALDMQTASGDLRCLRVSGRAACSAASGDVEIGAAGDRVDVRATSGRVRLGELACGANVSNVSGHVRVLSLEEGALRVRSVSGDVAVGVAQGVLVHVDVETMSGSIHSEIPLDAERTVPAQGSAAEISVHSVSGNVEIERSLEQVA